MGDFPKWPLLSTVLINWSTCSFRTNICDFEKLVVVQTTNHRV